MSPPATPVVDPFFAHIGPPRDALANLVDQMILMREGRGWLPDAASAAMAELSEEASLAGAWGDNPVRQAHSTGALLILAAEDHITSTTRLLHAEPLPVYSHLVLARAALEACGRAQWLFEAAIGVRRRVARGMTERLYSLAEQDRFPLGLADPAFTAARRRTIVDEARQQGFIVPPSKKSTPRYIGEERPNGTAIVRAALDDGADQDLGHAVFNYFSAAAHGTIYGLTQSMDPIRELASLQVHTLTQLKTDSRGVNSVLAAMTLAYVEAVERKRKLFGWDHGGWANGVIRALSAVRQALPS